MYAAGAHWCKRSGQGRALLVLLGICEDEDGCTDKEKRNGALKLLLRCPHCHLQCGLMIELIKGARAFYHSRPKR